MGECETATAYQAAGRGNVGGDFHDIWQTDSDASR
jgi:hypothetical protein